MSSALLKSTDSGSWPRWWWPASGVVFAGWLVLVAVIAPWVIYQGYRGESIDYVNRAFGGRADYDIWHYWAKWAWLITLPTLLLIAWLVGLPKLSGKGFTRKIAPPATPGELGAIRMLVGLVVLMNLLWERLPESAMFPREMHHLNTHGLLSVLYAIGYEPVVYSATALTVVQLLGILAAFMATVGLFTRFSVPATAVLALVIGATIRGYTNYFHTGMIPALMLAFLAFTRCGDGFSLDRLIRIVRGKPVVANRPARVYGYGRWLAWAILAVPYSMAGFSKLRNGGWFWWDGHNLMHGVLRDNLTPMEFNFDGGLFMLHWPVIFFTMMGLFAITFEAIFALVLVNRTLRWFLPLSMAGMHIGILFVQNILFFDLIILQAIFFPWRKLRRMAAVRLRRRRGVVSVLYDGNCPLCRKTRLALGGMDLLRRLRWVDFRAVPLERLRRRYGIDATENQLAAEMWVVAPESVTRGAEGYRTMAWRLPIMWPLLPLLYLPGAQAVTGTVYRAIAGSRTVEQPCDESCAVGRPTAAPVIAARPFWPALPAGVILTVASVFAVGWYYQIEAYPITGMQMYSGYAVGSPIEYSIPYWVHADGTRSVAHFADINHALAGARARVVVWEAFEKENPKHIALWGDFAQLMGKLYNSQAPPDKQAVAIEVEWRAWDYLNHPDDPNYGELWGFKRTELHHDVKVADRAD